MSSSKKHKPCEICGSTKDEYLYDIYDLETGKHQKVCFHHAEEDKQLKQLKNELSGE